MKYTEYTQETEQFINCNKLKFVFLKKTDISKS